MRDAEIVELALRRVADRYSREHPARLVFHAIADEIPKIIKDLENDPSRSK